MSVVARLNVLWIWPSGIRDTPLISGVYLPVWETGALRLRGGKKTIKKVYVSLYNVYVGAMVL